MKIVLHLGSPDRVQVSGSLYPTLSDAALDSRDTAMHVEETRPNPLELMGFKTRKMKEIIDLQKNLIHSIDFY